MTSTPDSQYVYYKQRREFGQQFGFGDKEEILVSISPDENIARQYKACDPVSRGTQFAKQMSCSEVNTERATYETHGINHTEGGWPKDICLSDPEQTTRYRRKIEKDELFISQVMNLTKPMEHCIFQNNAINIYESFFENCEPAPLLEPCSSRTLNVYRDPCNPKRPVTHLSWSPDGGTKLAVSHCDTTFQTDANDFACDSFIWEIENPNTPLLNLKPPSPIICLEYNPKDATTLVSGFLSGQVGAWDTRVEKSLVAISEREVCHQEAVNSVLWINSKTGTEFFSGSFDGRIIWWDTRKLNEPLESLLIDPIKTDDQIVSRSYGVNVLEYETTMPTKFMCGTDMGMVFVCNRKGKSPIEKINFRINTHLGPVCSIARNPSFLKNFLTVGDWTARIWSEDCRESSIIWTKYQSVLLTDGIWSPTKCSMFYISRMDGVLDAWDLLQQHNEPVLSIKVCDEPLLCMRAHESGRFISAASKNGATFLIELSDNMTTSLKNDKPLLTAMFERENKREKILEAKSREIKLKVKTAQVAHDDNGEAKANKANAILAACKQAEEEFLANVQKAKEKLGPGKNKNKSSGEQRDNATENDESFTDGSDFPESE